MKFDGMRAHSARPWMGSNAIHRAAPLLERCANFVAETVDINAATLSKQFCT